MQLECWYLAVVDQKTVQEGVKKQHESCPTVFGAAPDDLFYIKSMHHPVK